MTNDPNQEFRPMTDIQDDPYSEYYVQPNSTVPNLDDQQQLTVAKPRPAKLLPPAPAEPGLKKEAALHRLASLLPELLYRWSPHPSQSDYECVFCGRRPASSYNLDGFQVARTTTHDPECLGMELLKVL